MVYVCVVVGCKARRQKKEDRSFHKFPLSDPERLQQWTIRVSRQDENGEVWQPTPYSRICSDHFLPEDYELDTLRKVLRNTAVPSVFPCHYLHKTHRLSPKKRHFLHVEPSNSAVVQASSNSNNPLTSAKLSEHSYASLLVDMEIDLRNSKDALEKAKDTVREKNKVIKSLRQKLKRRDATISGILQLQVLSPEQHDLLKVKFDKDTLTLIENEVKASREGAHS